MLSLFPVFRIPSSPLSSFIYCLFSFFIFIFLGKKGGNIQMDLLLNVRMLCRSSIWEASNGSSWQGKLRPQVSSFFFGILFCLTVCLSISAWLGERTSTYPAYTFFSAFSTIFSFLLLLFFLLCTSSQSRPTPFTPHVLFSGRAFTWEMFTWGWRQPLLKKMRGKEKFSEALRCRLIELTPLLKSTKNMSRNER